jgi:hypothetical protein
LQPVDRERIIPWVYDASIHAIALCVLAEGEVQVQNLTAKAQRAAKKYMSLRD